MHIFILIVYKPVCEASLLPWRSQGSLIFCHGFCWERWEVGLRYRKEEQPLLGLPLMEWRRAEQSLAAWCWLHLKKGKLGSAGPSAAPGRAALLSNTCWCILCSVPGSSGCITAPGTTRGTSSLVPCFTPSPAHLELQGFSANKLRSSTLVVCVSFERRDTKAQWYQIRKCRKCKWSQMFLVVVALGFGALVCYFFSLFWFFVCRFFFFCLGFWLVFGLCFIFSFFLQNFNKNGFSSGGNIHQSCTQSFTMQSALQPSEASWSYKTPLIQCFLVLRVSRKEWVLVNCTTDSKSLLYA